MNRNKARARITAKRTGKPHLYVYNGVNFTEWLWENPTLDSLEEGEYANHLAAFCEHMDKVYGYARKYYCEVTDETNS